MTQPLAETRIDLDAYFERIGYHGERTPTLATLRAIHAQHATMIPFVRESLQEYKRRNN